MKKLHNILAIALTAGLSLTTATQAGVFSWTTIGSGTWSDLANWSGGAVPSNDGTATVYFASCTNSSNTFTTTLGSSLNLDLFTSTASAGTNIFKATTGTVTMTTNFFEHSGLSVFTFDPSVVLSTSTLKLSAGSVQFKSNQTFSSASKLIWNGGIMRNTGTVTVNGAQYVTSGQSMLYRASLGVAQYNLNGVVTGTLASTKNLDLAMDVTSGLPVYNLNWDLSGLTFAGSNAVRFGNGNMGGSSLHNGILNIQNSTALGPTSNSILSIDGYNSSGTNVATDLQVYLDGAFSVSNTVVILGNVTGTGQTISYVLGGKNAVGSTATWAGNITATAATVNFNDVRLRSTTAGAILAFTGSVNAGTKNLILDGAGIVAIGNTVTDSATFVNSGVLQLSGSNLLPAASGLVLNGGATAAGTLDLNGWNQTVGALSGTSASMLGVVTNNAAGTSIFTVSGAANNTFAGQIKDGGVSKVLALTKLGTGTLTLSGANSYTGTTLISGGKLIGTSTSALGTSALTISNSASFAYQPTAAGTLSLGSGVITLANGSVLGTTIGGTLGQSAIATTGSVAVTGTTTVNVYLIPGVAVTFGTNNLITAGSGLNGGTINLGNIYNATNFTVDSLVKTDTAVSLGLTQATELTNAYWKGGYSGGTNVWAVSNGTNSSNWTTDATGTAATSLIPGAGATITFSATGAAAANQSAMVLGANMSVAGIVVTSPSALALTADGNTLTLGTGGITVNNTLGNPNVTIAAPIILGGAQTWQNTSTTALTVSGPVTNGANLLTVQGTGNTTISGNLGPGTGGLTKAGAGILTLSGANSYTGLTTILSGTITGGVSATNRTVIPGDLVVGALEGGSPAGYNTPSNAAATVGKNITIYSNGTVNLGGGSHVLNSGYSTVIVGGTLQGNYINTAGGTFYMTGGIISGAIQSYGSSHPIRITSSASTSTAVVSASLTGKAAAYPTTITVADGAAEIDLLLSGVVGEAGGASMPLIKNGPGLLAMTAANTYTGLTTLSAGTLRLDFSAAGAPGSNIINNTTNSSTLSMGGGTLALVGKASTSNTQRFNGLTVTGGVNSIQLNAATSNPLLLTTGTITRTGGMVDFVLPSGIQSGTNGIVTTSTNTNGILGYWATVGGTDFATVNSSSNIVSYTGYNNVTRLSDGPQLISSASASNVRIVEGTGSPSNLTLASGTTTVNTLNQSATGGIATIDVTGKTLALNTILVGTGAGGLTISSGTLKSVGTALFLNNYSTNTATISAVIANGTGASTLNKSGSGMLILIGSNTYTGATYVNDGTLKAGVASVTGTSGAFGKNSAVTIANLATAGLDITGFDTQIGSLTGGGANGGNVTLGAATLTTGSDGTSTTYAGAISGSGGNLTKIGAGTLTLSGSSSYTGTTTLGGGLILFSTLNSLGAGTAITFGGGGLQWASSNTADISGRTVTLNTGTATFDTNGNDVTFANAIGNSGAGGLTKIGLGTLTLSVASTYTGPTLVTAGTLKAISGNAFGTGTVTVSTGALQLTHTAALASSTVFLLNGGTLQLRNDSSVTFAGAATTTLSNNVILDVNQLTTSGSNQTLSLGTVNIASGTVNVTGGNGYTLNLGNVILPTNNNTVTFNPTTANLITGTINSTGNGNLTKSGSGTWTLNGATWPKGYPGVITVTAGTLKLGLANAIDNHGGYGAKLAMTGGTFDLAGFSQALGSIDTASTIGTIINSSPTTAATLTVDDIN